MSNTFEAHELPPDAYVVEENTIEATVIENVVNVITQSIAATGQAWTESVGEIIANASAGLAIYMLTMIEVAGGDFKKKLPDFDDFQPIADRIAKNLGMQLFEEKVEPPR